MSDPSTFPSSTQILKAQGYYDSMDAMGEANSIVGKEGGSAKHKGVHHLAYGEEVPWKSRDQVDAELALEGKPGITAKEWGERIDYRFKLDALTFQPFRNFLRDHHWEIEDHEHHYISPLYRLRAHTDQTGRFVLSGGKLSPLSIVEVKTGAMPSWVQKQTALQALAAEDIKMPRFCLHLPGDGNYRLIPHTDYRDFPKARNFIENMWIRAEDLGRWWEKEAA
jgi:hypothetical protein